MCGDLLGAQRAEEGREGREREHLAAELQAGRHAEVRDLADGVSEGHLGARPGVRAGPARAPDEEREEDDRFHRLGGGRGERAAADAERREAEVPEDERPAEDRVEHVAREAHSHRSARVAERLPVMGEGGEDCACGRAEGEGREERLRVRHERGVDVDGVEERRRVARAREHGRAGERPEGDARLRVAHALVLLAEAHGVRDADLHPAHEAEDRHVAEERDRHRDADAAERLRPETADELGVDEAHEGLAAHGGRDWRREREHRAQRLAEQPRDRPRDRASQLELPTHPSSPTRGNPVTRNGRATSWAPVGRASLGGHGCGAFSTPGAGRRGTTQTTTGSCGRGSEKVCARAMTAFNPTLGGWLERFGSSNFAARPRARVSSRRALRARSGAAKR